MFRLWLPKLPPLTASRTRIFIHRLSQTQDTIIPQHDPLRSNIFPNMDCSGTKTSFKAPIPPCSKMTSASHKTQRPQQRGCRALCCSCRLSVSSSDDAAESPNSDRFASISTLAHAMVQERLEQMIKESQEARHKERRRRPRSEGNITAKFIVMVALEKSSYDPRQDFRESMIEMIMANKIQEPKDLRGLLNYYVSMNSEEYHAIILEVFYEVCSNMFLRCKWH